MERVGEKGGFRTTGTFGRVVGPHLGAVRAQVGMGVLEPGDGTVTQAPSDRHQCVEILQLVEFLGREGDAEVMGVSWSTGKLGVQMTASQLRVSQLRLGSQACLGVGQYGHQIGGMCQAGVGHKQVLKH